MQLEEMIHEMQCTKMLPQERNQSPEKLNLGTEITRNKLSYLYLCTVGVDQNQATQYMRKLQIFYLY